MRTVKTIFCIILGLITPISALVSAGETVTYSGSGRSNGHETTMTLGNGDTVVMARSDGVASISTNPPGLLATKCTAMGLVKSDNSFRADYYCTLRENERDGFDIKGVEGSKEGTATVIGGSGKWEGATGSGKITLLSHDEDVSTYTYELTITTP